MDPRKSRLNVLLLALCQALFMTTTSAIITSVAVVGDMLLAQDKWLSTLPIACQFAATTFIAMPAAFFMKRVGRQTGFIAGSLIGAIGAALASYAIMQGSFGLFCLGAVLIGSFNGFAQQFRFAAADTASEEFRSRAISLVLAGGVVAAITGPTLAQFTTNLFEPVLYAGTFAAIVLVYAAIIVVLLFVDIPPPSEEERSATGRPLAVIALQPKFVVAVMGAVFGYLVMSFLMTVTPLAMKDCGFEFAAWAVVIQGHILGMYAPSFFTGNLIRRFGAPNIMIVGAVLQALCIVINLAGIEFLNFFVALLLLGVGWNFLFVGGTALLTECYQPSEKAKCQGFNDFCVWGFVMVGALLSGTTNHEFGWSVVNLGVAPFVVIMGIAVIWLKMARVRLAA